MTNRNEPGKWKAGLLAVIVHVLFFGLLIFGVNWQSEPTGPVQAELWEALPPAAKPEPRPKPEPKPEPKPQPKPEPKPEPEPPKPEPVKKPEPAKPDIALQERERKEKEKKEQQAEEEKRKREEEKKRKEEEKRKVAEEQRRQQLVKEQLARQDELLAREQQQLAQQRQAAARAGLVDDYKSRIQRKIRGYIILPPELQGNPQAEFLVTLLPSGEVLQVKLTKSSGNTVYDAAVERAIYKAQPLPLPPDPGLFDSFRELHLKFRPQD